MSDYFELLRKNAETTWGPQSLIRYAHGTIGRPLNHAQTVGSLIPTTQTWDAYSHINREPQEVKIEQVFLEPPRTDSSQAGCVLSQEFMPHESIPQVDADGDVVMVDAQNIIPE